MKKILIGFIVIGILTFVGCKKYQGNTNPTNTNSSSSGIQYGAGATDVDGNTYQSVIIGTQEWMVENLRTKKYLDGTAIPNVASNTQGFPLSTAAWSHFDNDNKYDTIYGKLYNWYAVETGKLCPAGWHVPTDAEWNVLTDYLGANGHSGTEGTALKATSGWNNNGNGTDDYGWLGLPGGCRNPNGSFYAIGRSGYCWSSSQTSAWDACYLHLGDNDDYVGRDSYDKRYGYSVRCFRD